MVLTIEAIIFYLLLLDSVCGNLIVWFSPKLLNWYTNTWKKFSRVFPATKGWMVFYLILVCWIGYSLNRLGIV
ncbi:hypothetical protein HOH11_00880 [Candidatus Woesearchaeota archaeon]|jgi:hypothetical protein|nr:hypothetical protein [Candidatus Woesearchaeota archaeon]MBT6023144.1 hypothetical protein [Candidatus Woesearchaeota archaeon]